MVENVVSDLERFRIDAGFLLKLSAVVKRFPIGQFPDQDEVRKYLESGNDGRSQPVRRRPVSKVDGVGKADRPAYGRPRGGRVRSDRLQRPNCSK
jgi:hypothetical protein